ncbi:MAG: LytR C-terminal domain-containing protein [Candidatus Berkelbacteria bacterium]|nr:LytR C-terminal domain-containing protein [Candidatus Berkelbacteria bacterium]
MAKSLDIIDPKKEMAEEPKQVEQKPEMADDDNDNGDFEEEKSRSGIFYLILGILAIVVAAAFALYILLKDDKSKTTDSAQSTVTVTTSQTATPAVSTSATAAAQTTSTAGTTSSDFTGSSVRVANGNNTSGEAAKIKKLLEGKGFTVTKADNASKQYTESIIYYKTGKEDLANALKSAITSSYNATIEKSDSIAGTYDAVVVLGTK